MESSLTNILLREQESQLGGPEPFSSLAALDFFRTLRQALKAGTEARRCLYINKSSLPSRCPFLAKLSLSIEDGARVVAQLTGNFTEQAWTGFLGAQRHETRDTDNALINKPKKKIHKDKSYP